MTPKVGPCHRERGKKTIHAKSITDNNAVSKDVVEFRIDIKFPKFGSQILIDFLKPVVLFH